MSGRPASRPALLPRPAHVLLWGFGLFVVALGLLAVAYATTSIPSPNSFVTAQSTLVYYADGHTVLGRIGSVYRVDVNLSQVPIDVQRAVLAAEDRHYYSEPGISATGIARSLFVDLTGGTVQGGSTITQQYAKNAYLSQERTLTRKLREILIAVKLDHTRSKARVLQDYLNSIYFGRGAYGIEAASQAYFGVDVGRLTVAQGALLAGLIQSPSAYDPLVNPTAAHARWHYVINGMVSQHWLPPEVAAGLQFPKVGPPRRTSGMSGPLGFVLLQVEHSLQKMGYDESRLNLGGYRVVTTIDFHAEQAAINAENNVLGPSPKLPVSALVALQPKTGAIRALYGGRDYGNPHYPASFINLAMDTYRQPGSSFKPYTLITALEHGISLNTVFDGRSPVYLQGYGANNQVNNDNNEQCPSCTLTLALARSINTVFVPLAARLGPDNVRQTAYTAGVSRVDSLGGAQPGAGISIGIYDVRPIDQAAGFNTIAAQGYRAAPYLIQRIDSHSGNHLFTAHAAPTRVFRADVMANTTYAMQQVLDNPLGTAHGALLAGGRPAAGKTGTTTSNRDAWFIGFTPQLTAAVWMGNADGAPLTNVPGYSQGVYGGTLPATIWKQFMDTTLAGKPALPFPPPGKNQVARPPATATPRRGSPSPSAPARTSPGPKPTVTLSPLPTISPTPVLTGSPSPSPSPSPSSSATVSPATAPRSRSG